MFMSWKNQYHKNVLPVSVRVPQRKKINKSERETENSRGAGTWLWWLSVQQATCKSGPSGWSLRAWEAKGTGPGLLLQVVLEGRWVSQLHRMASSPCLPSSSLSSGLFWFCFIVHSPMVDLLGTDVPPLSTNHMPVLWTHPDGHIKMQFFNCPLGVP